MKPETQKVSPANAVIPAPTKSEAPATKSASINTKVAAVEKKPAAPQPRPNNAPAIGAPKQQIVETKQTAAPNSGTDAFTEISDVNKKGLAIAQEADRRDDGFQDFTVDINMVLVDQKGNEINREMKQQSLEVPGDGDKTVISFDQPLDLKGTAILTFSHRNGADDQWLYLPAVKRVKRISSSTKSGPFMGSEFAYEDLSSQEVEKFDYKFLRMEPCREFTCYVIERTPKDDKSGYSRQLIWMDSAQFRTLKVDYYDRKESLLKTMEADNFALYLEKYWRPGKMLMTNHQTGKKTILNNHNYHFRTGLSDSDFTRNSIQRMR